MIVYNNIFPRYPRNTIQCTMMYTRNTFMIAVFRFYVYVCVNYIYIESVLFLLMLDNINNNNNNMRNHYDNCR